MAELGDAHLRCPACDAPILLPLTQRGADLTSITLAIDLSAVRAHIATEHPQEIVVPDQPSVGRIVHYRSYGTPGGEYTPECRAAVITETTEGSDAVGLAVLNPTGMFFHPLADGGCAHDDGQQYGGTWHWPERVEDTGS